jgi:uncharacterized membrane protein YozB (DUF420 family)
MTSIPAVQTGRWDHVFFSAMSAAMAVVVGVGFSRTYPVRIAAGTVSPLAHLHGAVFALWMILFLVQALLVAQGKTRWHRRVGVGAAFFAVVILVSGTVTAIVAVRHGFHGNPPTPQTPLAFLLTAPLRDMVVFGSLTGAAIALSRDVQTHKRLMLMATLGGLVPAGAGRSFNNPLFGLIVLLVLLAAGPVYDWVSRRRVHGAYIWGVAVTLGSSPIFYALAQTSVWQSFAQGLIE